jgi:hypothetical protein
MNHPPGPMAQAMTNAANCRHDAPGDEKKEAVESQQERCDGEQWKH